FKKHAKTVVKSSSSRSCSTGGGSPLTRQEVCDINFSSGIFLAKGRDPFRAREIVSASVDIGSPITPRRLRDIFQVAVVVHNLGHIAKHVHGRPALAFDDNLDGPFHVFGNASSPFCSFSFTLLAAALNAGLERPWI